MSNSMNLTGTVTLYQEKNGMWILLEETKDSLIELGSFSSKVEALQYFVRYAKAA